MEENQNPVSGSNLVLPPKDRSSVNIIIGVIVGIIIGGSLGALFFVVYSDKAKETEINPVNFDQASVVGQQQTSETGINNDEVLQNWDEQVSVARTAAERATTMANLSSVIPSAEFYREKTGSYVGLEYDADIQASFVAISKKGYGSVRCDASIDRYRCYTPSPGVSGSFLCIDLNSLTTTPPTREVSKDPSTVSGFMCS